MTGKGTSVLERLGFSNYEARAYLALLGNAPVTGYQLSKLSGVPRSRIYETLEKLTQKGLVFTLQVDPAQYAPLDSQELLARLRAKFDDSLKTLEDEIANLSARTALESIWTIQGREHILAKARAMIKGAKETVYLAAWNQVIQEVKAELEEASARGVRIIVVSCGEVNLAAGTLYRHRFEEQLCPVGGSSIDLVIDGREVLVGEALLGDTCQAAWTRNVGLVFIAGEYIRHEVYIHKLIEKLGTGFLDKVQEAFLEGLAEIPHQIQIVSRLERTRSLAEETKEFARSLGADLVGVASVDRFEEAPEGHRPEDILPQARTVVVCAKRIPNGSLEGPATSYHHAMSVLHAQLDLIASLVALFLERGGGLAVPVPADEPYYHWEAERLYGRGDLSHKYAAQAAGLGRLGKNSLLITPEFGNRVHLVSVVTSVELAPDEVIQEELCPSGCSLCIEACPAGAIEEGQRVNQRLCRGAMLQELAKGTLIESCRECRRVCKVGVRKGR